MSQLTNAKEISQIPDGCYKGSLTELGLRANIYIRMHQDSRTYDIQISGTDVPYIEDSADKGGDFDRMRCCAYPMDPFKKYSRIESHTPPYCMKKRMRSMAVSAVTFVSGETPDTPEIYFEAGWVKGYVHVPLEIIPPVESPQETDAYRFCTFQCVKHETATYVEYSRSLEVSLDKNDASKGGSPFLGK